MPRGFDPDTVRRMRDQMVTIDTTFGEPATLRKYISASGGNPEYGIGDTWMYQARPTIADMRALRPDEIQMVGGQNYQGGYYFWTLDEVNERDEIIYPVHNGEVFRVATKPDRDTNNMKWGFIGLRAQVTGQF